MQYNVSELTIAMTISVLIAVMHSMWSSRIQPLKVAIYSVSTWGLKNSLKQDNDDDDDKSLFSPSSHDDIASGVSCFNAKHANSNVNHSVMRSKEIFALLFVLLKQLI